MEGFAQKHMQRYGWSEGKGLGRTESGMRSAIKVHRKNNTGGLGHDQGAEFTFHWWDHIFNKAASSFKVTESVEGGALIEKCEGKKIVPLLIANKRGLATKLGDKTLLYGTFVKSGTYDSNSVKPCGSVTDGDGSDGDSSDDDDDDDDKKGLVNDTLDKMFKKTGLTGHKAARHGHSLNGKLQRLQRQEQQQQQTSTASATYTKLNESDETPVCGDAQVVKKKKKEKKKDDSVVLDDPVDVLQTDSSDNIVKKKKKKKKKIDIETELSQVKTCLGKFSSSITDITEKLTKHRKHKLIEDGSNVCLLDDQPKKKKKKKK